MKFKFKPADLGIFNTKNIEDCLNGFAPGCRLMGLTSGHFSLIDLIHGVLKKTGQAHVVCTTWSAGIKDANNIKWMVDTNLIRTFRLITDYSFAARKKEYLISIEEMFGLDNIRTGEIHAKFVLIHNEDLKVCIRTSMNLNANKTCENFEIDEDAEIFDFYMNYVEHTFGDMPRGFVNDSYRANLSLDRFFQKNKTVEKWWEKV